MSFRRLFAVLLLLVLTSALASCALPGSSSAPADSPPFSLIPGGKTSAACTNPLQPVVAGAKWTYSTSGATTGTFTRSITDVRADGFTEKAESDTSPTTTAEWSCQGGALISLSPPGTLRGLLQDLSTKGQLFNMDSAGVTYPSIVIPGDSWAQSFDFEGTQNFQGKDVDVTGDMTISCTAGLNETVAVAAGLFEAMRVDCQIVGKVIIEVGEADILKEASGTSHNWYVTDVGLVKLETEFTDAGLTTTELTSYTIP